MARSTNEADWRLFREVREVALERFCQRVLSEISAIASESDKTSHQRYLNVYRLIERRDEELGNAFNDPRRSTMLPQLASMQAQGLVTEEELARFSAELRDTIEFLVERGRRGRAAHGYARR